MPPQPVSSDDPARLALDPSEPFLPEDALGLRRQLVVIVPTRNERGTIADLVTQVLCQEQSLPGYRLNLLVVDGLSEDGTREIVSELASSDPRVHILALQEHGLGLALLKAYEFATSHLAAEVLAQMDADFSHEPSRLGEMLAPLSEGYELAIGSRFAAGGGTADWPLTRRLLSRNASRLIRLLSGRWSVKDWTSGYRAFTVGLYRRLDLASITYRDYTVQPAFVYEALRCGARVREVPIIFANRRWGKSKLPMFGYAFHLTRHFLAARLRGADQPAAEDVPVVVEGAGTP